MSDSDETLNGIPVGELDEAFERAEAAIRALAGGGLFLTGATGFFGRWLLAVLIRAVDAKGLDFSITVLTRSKRNFVRSAPALATHRSVRVVEGDVRFFEYPKGRFTHVVHAATDTSVEADRNPLLLIDTIVEGTRRVLEFAAAAGAERVLLTSSGAVYGAQPEHLPLVPEGYPGACPTTDMRSSYGQAKRLAEQLATIYNRETQLKTVVARPFSFIGPGMPLDAHFAIGNFIRDAAAGKTIAISGDGSPVRSYLYAGDLCAWLLRLLMQGEPGAAYNVGSDRAVSIAELAAVVSHVVPDANGFEIRGTPNPGGFRSRYVPSIERARAELGLEVWTSLEEAIRRTAHWAARAEKHVPVPIEAHLNEHAHVGAGQTLVIDVDGVVAELVPDNDYAKAGPLAGNIAHINRLYDAGYRIVMFTARGSATGIDWSDVTRGQFERWGLRYHELKFGKPAADYYVDDRLLSIGQLARFGFH